MKEGKKHDELKKIRKGGGKWRVRKQKQRKQNTGQPTVTVQGAKGEGMEMGVLKLYQIQTRRLTQRKIRKKEVSLPNTLYYPLQQEMLIYKDCVAELLVPYCGHTTPTQNSFLPLLTILQTTTQHLCKVKLHGTNAGASAASEYLSASQSISDFCYQLSPFVK